MMGKFKKSRMTLLAANSAAVLLFGVAGSAYATSGFTAHNTGIVTHMRVNGGAAAQSTVRRDAQSASVRVVSATVNGNTLKITLSGDLQYNIVNFDAFTVLDDGNTDVVTNATMAGRTLTLTLTSAVSSGDTVTVGYTPSGWYDLTDANGNKVAAFSHVAVTNTTNGSNSSGNASTNTTNGTNSSGNASNSSGNGSTNSGVALPTPVRAVVNGRTLTVMFSRTLRTGPADPNSLIVRDASHTESVIRATAKGIVLTLTLMGAVSSGDTVTVGYSPTGSHDLTNTSGGKVAAFLNMVVTNKTKSAPSTIHNNQTVKGNWRMVGTSPHLGQGAGSYYTNATNNVQVLTTVNGVLYAGTEDGVFSFSKGAWHLIGSSRGVDTGTLLYAFGSLFATFRSLGLAFFDDKKSTWYVDKIQNMDAGSLSVIGETLYAATDKGVFALQSNGSWRMMGSSAKLSAVGRLTNVGGQLYADAQSPSSDGTRDLYVYRNGTWQALGTVNSYYYPVHSINAVVRYDNTLYAATDNGVFAYSGEPWSRSIKGTWTQVGLDNLPVNTLLVMKGVLYAGTTGNLSQGGVYALKSGSWVQVGPSIDLDSRHDLSAEVHTLTGLHGVLYAGTSWGVYSFNPR